jgi:NADH-quinone oxidoreductase subunit J
VNPVPAAAAGGPGPTPGDIILFVVMALWVTGFAIWTITRKNPVTAVMSLVATFFGLAAIYASLSAHFLAVLQVLVYAGAIMVLFIFVVMILNREEVAPLALRPMRILGVIATVYLLAVFWNVVAMGVDTGKSPPVVSDSFGTVASIGDILFREFLYPFEAISLLLLVAIVGGVIVSRSHRQEERAQATVRRLRDIRLKEGPPAEDGKLLSDASHH